MFSVPSFTAFKPPSAVMALLVVYAETGPGRHLTMTYGTGPAWVRDGGKQTYLEAVDKA